MNHKYKWNCEIKLQLVVPLYHEPITHTLFYSMISRTSFCLVTCNEIFSLRGNFLKNLSMDRVDIVIMILFL